MPRNDLDGEGGVPGRALAADWYLRGRLRLAHLRLLATLEQTKHVGETARRLATTQPAVSRMLAELEEMVETQLFVRTPKGSFPTAHGRAMIRHALWILGDLERLGRDWAVQGEEAAERVVLGINSSSAAWLVPNALRRLEAAGAGVTVVVREGSVEALLPDLASRQIDLVVARLGATTSGADFVEELLFHESMCVVCAAQHPLAGAAACTWTELGGYPWIMPPVGSPVRAALDLIFMRERVRPASCVESASVLTNMIIMDRGRALSLMPQRVATYHAPRARLVVLPVDLPDVFGPLGIVHHASLELTSGMQLVKRCLHEEAGEAKA